MLGNQSLSQAPRARSIAISILSSNKLPLIVFTSTSITHLPGLCPNQFQPQPPPGQSQFHPRP